MPEALNSCRSMYTNPRRPSSRSWMANCFRRLSSIDGMGEKAAEAVEEAAKDGKYLSLDDFRQRTKVSKTVIDLMVELGILKRSSGK